MAVVLMRQKFKAISVMQLYFLDPQQSSFLCQPFYQEVKTLFSLFGLTQKRSHWLLLNHIIIAGKLVIYHSRLKNILPSFIS